MLKKATIFLLVFAFAFTGFVMDVEADRPYEGESIDVLVWRDALTEAVMARVDEFEEATGIDVNIDDLPTDSLIERAAINLTGETGEYDLIAIDEPYTPRFHDYLLPYDEWPEGEVYSKTNVEDLVQAAVDGGTFRGELGGIPVNANVYMFVFRQDLIDDPANQEAFEEEYGYELSNPETTDEMMDMAEFFTDEPNRYGFAPFTYTAEGATVEAIWVLNTFGTQILDEDLNLVLDREKAIEAFEFYKGLMEYAPPGADNFGHDGTISNMNAGQLFMTLQWPAIIAGHEDPEESMVAGDLGYETAPSGPTGEASGVTGTWVLGMPEVIDDDQKQAAAEFGYWWTGAEAHEELVHEGMAPVRTEFLEDEELQDDYPWYEGQLKNFEIADTRPRYHNYTEVSSVIMEYFNRAVTGDMPVPEAVDSMKEGIEDVLDG